jgi:hypothetical protein
MCPECQGTGLAIVYDPISAAHKAEKCLWCDLGRMSADQYRWWKEFGQTKPPKAP